MARTGFWRGGDGVTSVLGWREGRKQDSGVSGKSRDAPGTVCKNGGKFKLSTVQCTGVVVMARTGFWRGGDGVTSVLAWREGRKQDFGVPGKSRDAPGNLCKKGGKFKFNTVQCNGVMGMARIGFWRGGDGMTSVLAGWEG